MKTYKLLKDLPFAKAGDEFGLYRGDDRSMILAQKEWDKHMYEIDISDIENFDEWFEEVKEIKKIDLAEHFFIILGGRVDIIKFINYTYSDETEQEYIKKKEECKSVGNCFETREEAEKYLKYLKAKAIIKKDTKGFRPDWGNENEILFYGYWDLKGKISYSEVVAICKEPQIYFKSRVDIEESFKKHPDEWRTYLTYEQ